MGRKSKPFVDKKSAAHFHLVRRSQRDPLIADESASPFVLVPDARTSTRSSKLRDAVSDERIEDDDRAPDFEDLDEEQLRELEEELEGFEERGDPGQGREGQRAPSAKAAAKAKGKEKEREREREREQERDFLSNNRNPGEAAKFGIYYDDTDYDYTQHLKIMGAPGAVFVPAAAEKKKAEGFVLKKGLVEELIPEESLPSKFEEDIGMLNLAAPVSGPRPELGEDILEVLEALEDEAFVGDFDDELIETLNKSGEDFTEEEDEDEGEEGYGSEDDFWRDRNAFLKARGRAGSDDEDDRLERGSHLTNFSMSSSALGRTKGLQILDERFDKMMEDYEDDEIGELEQEDPRVLGTTGLDHFEDILDEFLEKHGEVVYKDVVKAGIVNSKNEVEKERARLVVEESQEASDVDEDDLFPPQKEKSAWDCESILSTYSNLENRPRMIVEAPRKKIVLSKLGIPSGFTYKSPQAAADAGQPQREESRSQRRKEEPVEAEAEAGEQESEEEGSEDDSGAESVSAAALSQRSKQETPEEKRERKRAVKEQKKVRRAEKKSTKAAFKNEKLRQERLNITNPSMKNLVHIA